MIHVSDRFDAGNIEVRGGHAGDLRLAIKTDTNSKHYQWFYFRVTGAKGQRLRLVIENAKGASYEGGWSGYRACASYDTKTWFRVDTAYEEGQLVVTHDVRQDAVWYAYFAPYAWAQHQALVAEAQAAEGVTLSVLGETLDGRTMDLLRVGTPAPDKLPIWIISRQHPGETMAEHFMEGVIHRLVDPAEALAHQLRDKAVFYLVPNMNPDGGVRGHLRVNACGTNLNRAWDAPTMDASPEVYLVKERMTQTGVALCLDVHGDEALPYNFIAGPDGVEALPDHVLPMRDAYCEALERACPDFQRQHGYPKAAKGKANMTMCTNQLAHAFGAVAMTLEQPFKDNANRPDERFGWSPARCRVLGRAQLEALSAIIDALPR